MPRAEQLRSMPWREISKHVFSPPCSLVSMLCLLSGVKNSAICSVVNIFFGLSVVLHPKRIASSTLSRRILYSCYIHHMLLSDCIYLLVLCLVDVRATSTTALVLFLDVYGPCRLVDLATSLPLPRINTGVNR